MIIIRGLRDKMTYEYPSLPPFKVGRICDVDNIPVSKAINKDSNEVYIEVSILCPDEFSITF